MEHSSLARRLLTLGLAYVFLSFGIGKFVSPPLWIGWIPPWMEGWLQLTRDQWLPVFGAVETALGLFLLIPNPKSQRVVTILIILYLAAITTQTGAFSDIGVRDTGLLAAAMSLLLLTNEQKRAQNKTAIH